MGKSVVHKNTKQDKSLKVNTNTTACDYQCEPSRNFNFLLKRTKSKQKLANMRGQQSDMSHVKQKQVFFVLVT